MTRRVSKGYGSHSLYDLRYLNELIYDKQHYVDILVKNGSEYKGHNGLLYLYDRYTSSYVNLSKRRVFTEML